MLIVGTSCCSNLSSVLQHCCLCHVSNCFASPPPPPVSQADCYVSLWLPTATRERSRTKTVRNSDNPVWNETFYFRIQSQVKVRSQSCLLEAA